MTQPLWRPALLWAKGQRKDRMAKGCREDSDRKTRWQEESQRKEHTWDRGRSRSQHIKTRLVLYTHD